MELQAEDTAVLSPAAYHRLEPLENGHRGELFRSKV